MDHRVNFVEEPVVESFAELDVKEGTRALHAVLARIAHGDLALPLGIEEIHKRGELLRVHQLRIVNDEAVVRVGAVGQRPFRGPRKITAEPLGRILDLGIDEQGLKVLHGVRRDEGVDDGRRAADPDIGDRPTGAPGSDFLRRQLV